MASLRYRRNLRNQNFDAIIIAGVLAMEDAQLTPSIRRKTTIAPKIQDISGSIMRDILANLENTGKKDEKGLQNLKYIVPNYIGIGVIKGQVNSLVDLVTQTINVDTVVQTAKSIRTCMKTADDIVVLLNTISNGLRVAEYDKNNQAGWELITTQITSFKNNLKIIDDLGEDCVTYLEANIYDLFKTLTDITTDDIYIKKLTTNLTDIQALIKKNIISIGTIRQAEDITLNIIQNVTDTVDFGFIYRRIAYLKSILDGVDQTCIVYNKNIGDALLCAIDMIINKTDLAEVENYMECINVVMKKNIEVIAMLDKCQLIIISIIVNFTDKTDYGFVIRRIKYLQETLAAFSL